MAAPVSNLNKFFIERLCATDRGCKDHANSAAIYSLQLRVMNRLLGTGERELNEAVHILVVGRDIIRNRVKVLHLTDDLGTEGIVPKERTTTQLIERCCA